MPFPLPPSPDEIKQMQDAWGMIAKPFEPLHALIGLINSTLEVMGQVAGLFNPPGGS